MFEIQIAVEGAAAPRRVEVRSAMTLGPEQGLPPNAIDLDVRSGMLVICPGTIPCAVGSRALAPDERRALLPGEEARVGKATLRLTRIPPAVPATVILTRELLRPGRGGSLGAAAPSLLWLNGPELGKRVVLVDEATFLGRGEGCVGRVNDSKASRMHAKLVRAREGFSVVDLLSANGLFVDGKRVEGTTPLRGGEILLIGSTEIAFDRPGAPAVEPAPPRKEEAEAKPAPRPPKPKIASSFEAALFVLAAAATALVGGAVWWALR